MKTENRNFIAFVWHSFWLALADTFAEKNTVLPGLILFAGGTQTEIGYLTSIVIGVPLLSQLLFAGYLTKKPKKKLFLLSGIYFRVFAFAGIAWTLFSVDNISSSTIIISVFAWMLLYTISGAFAGISYTDILGKSIKGETRKRFLVTRQFISSLGILISALMTRNFLSSFSFPENYQLMFSFAAALLFTAAFGFIAIKEKPSEIKIKTNFKYTIRSIPLIIKRDKNLFNFIATSNLLGLSLTIVPFFIAYTKAEFHLEKSMIGNFLLFQITGMILSNLFWMNRTKKLGFKGMLKISSVLYGILPVTAVLISKFLPIYYLNLIFLISGISLSARKIAIEGTLLEISNESNRPLYSGIFGTFNLTTALFPLISGVLISILGYEIIFIGVGILSMTSLYFISRMECPIDSADNIQK